MKQGLIMEGGGMSGVFTAGVMDVLMKNNIKFDGTIGVSAGAIFGINIKSGQIGRVIRFNKKYCRDPRYVSMRSFFITGDIFGADFCYRQLTYELDPFDYKAFEANPMEFYSVSTNLETGKAVYHKCYKGLLEDMIWCRASASIPVLSKRVEINGKSYLDGGIADSIPIKFFERKGYKRNIVILTKPRKYRMKPADYMFWARIRYRNYPNFIKAISKRHIIYNKALEYVEAKERSGEIIVVRPSHSTVAKMIERNPDNLQITYEDGIRQCEKVIDKIRIYVNQTKMLC